MPELFLSFLPMKKSRVALESTDQSNKKTHVRPSTQHTYIGLLLHQHKEFYCCDPFQHLVQEHLGLSRVLFQLECQSVLIFIQKPQVCLKKILLGQTQKFLSAVPTYSNSKYIIASPVQFILKSWTTNFSFHLISPIISC